MYILLVTSSLFPYFVFLLYDYKSEVHYVLFYLKCVPPGNWQCPNCCEKDDHSRPIIHLRSPNAKKNTSSSKEKHSSSDVSSSLESNKKLDLSTDATAGSMSSSCVNKVFYVFDVHCSLTIDLLLLSILMNEDLTGLHL
jgi:hypothetical protein